MGVLDGLEPREVFQYFEEICGIPHGSGNTKAISDYCVAFAREKGLRYRQDESNNVIIWKPGTKGYEASAPVIIQGHLDMVCEKESGCMFDFEKEGLKLRLEDGIVSAEGTTLGGDDGIAVAMAMAILAAEDIPHPPLEVVFTVDEEIGMLGASALDFADLEARTMLNLDSEEEGYLLVSCAGGVGAQVHIPIEHEKGTGCPGTVTVTGLIGGHSGVEIDKGRANACQLLGRVLYHLSRQCRFHLAEVAGGLKDNAIPREAKAEILLDMGEKEICQKEIQEMAVKIQKELELTDPEVQISVIFEREEATRSVMTEQAGKKVITALVELPGGVQRMSFAIPGLVQTSLNLGVLKTEESEVTCSFSVRSSVESEKDALVEQITCLTQLLGGRVTCQGEYPAWEYRQDSPLRDLMIKIYQEQYGKEPVVQALHAGVECGIFSGRLPGLDCVSFGPDMKDIHTPKESMDAASVKRTWEYTLEILRRLQ